MPVAIEIGADLFVLAALIVLIGMTKGLQYTLVALLRGLAGAAGRIPFIGSWIASHIDHLSHYLYNQLGVGILHMEHTAVWFFHQLATLARELGTAIEGLARTIEHAIQALLFVHLPAWTRTLLRLLQHQIAALGHRAHAIERRLVHDTTKAIAAPWPVLHGLERRLVHAYEALRHAIAVTLPREIGALGRRVGVLEREVAHTIPHRLKWAERLALGALAGGIVLKMLARVAPWVRCSNVNRVGRTLCRFPVKALEELLVGGLEALAFADLCAVTRLVAGATKASVPILHALVVVEGAALCNGEHSAAPALPLNAVALPVPTSPILL